MVFIIVDTSLPSSFLLLCNREKVLDSFQMESGTVLSETFFSKLTNILETNNCTFDDIQFIFCSLGPGSYTGVRVGISFTQTLRYLKQIPVYGFCSLCCMIPNDDGPFLAVLDAKSQGFFTLKGKKNKMQILFDRLPKRQKENHFSTPIVVLSDQFTNTALNAPKVHRTNPNFSYLHKLAIKTFDSNKNSDNFLNPYYLPIANNETTVLV